MDDKEQRQGQEQDRERPLVQARAREQGEAANVHGVANVPVRASGDERPRSFKRSGCSPASRDKHPAQASARIPPRTIRIGPRGLLPGGREILRLRSKTRTRKATQPQKTRKPVM